MNVLIIPFISYASNPKINNILVDYHLSKIEKMPVDEIYFSGTRMGFKNETVNINGKKLHYLDNSAAWHQENVEFAVKRLSDQDKFIITDSDCLIYDYSLFNEIFSWLDEYDIVSNLDGGTRIMPTYGWDRDYDLSKEDPYRNLMYNIPLMRPKEFRSGRTRFAATLFGCSTNFYRKYNFPKPSSEFESMEQFSRNVAEKYPDVKVKELLDFRNSLFIQKNYNGQQTQPISLGDLLNLPDVKESYDKFIHEVIGGDDRRCVNELFIQSKYYHIRNIGGIFTAVRKVIDRENLPDTQFSHNDSEGIRLLTWLYILIEILSKNNNNYKDCLNYCEDIINYYNIPKDFFDIALKRTKEFHRTDLL